MREELINNYLERNMLRKRSPDRLRASSLFESAKRNGTFTLNIEINEDSSTLVFREIYESIRQIGDALWWIKGYEALSHEPSIEILKDLEVKNKFKLMNIDRFRRIRNDANYRGYNISVEQAKEIIDFWKNCGEDLINAAGNA